MSDPVPPKPQFPPVPPLPPPVAPPGRSVPGRRRRWRTAALVAALAVVAASVLVVAGRSADDGPGGSFVSLPGPHALLLDGVSGRLEITGGRGPTAVAEYLPEGSGAAGRVGFGPADGDGAVPVGCADGGGPFGPCHGLLRLTVPDGTALTVRQESGEIALSGVRGDLALSLASVRCTAVGLRPRRASVAVRSGSADLAFAAAPQALTVESTSASTVLRLPSGGPDDGYAFESDAVSADVRIGLPSRPDSGRSVRLRTVSASVAVLPSPGGEDGP